MYRLLTEAEKRKVSREYTSRRIIIILFALLLVLVMGAVGILPSYILSNIRQKEALEQTKIIDGSDLKKEEKELEAWLVETNRRLAALSPKLDTDKPSDFIEKAVSQKIVGISITGFFWNKTKDKTSLSINGVAKDRQTLVMFGNNLSSSDYFSDVILPVSDFAKDKDINFQIKLSLP